MRGGWPRGLVLATCLPLAGCTAGGGPSPGPPDVAAPVVVVGVGGLTWDHVSPQDTPRLWGLLTGGAAAGAITVRQDGPSCPVDGWLSLSAGRLVAGREPSACGPLPDVLPEPGGQASVPAWAELEDRQDATEFDPQLGLLAETLDGVDGPTGPDSEVCTTAVGPGAALALADGDGAVARYRETPGPDTFACPVTLVDVGTVADPGRDLPRVDQRVGEILDRAPADATMLVTGVSQQPGGHPELAAALLTGPAVTGGSRYLVSSSTRWDGVVRLLDVPSTLLDALGVPDPEDLSGAPIRPGGQRPAAPEETVARLGDITRADQVRGTWADDLRSWWGGAQLVLYAVALAAVGRAWAPPGSGRAFTAVVTVFAATPLALYLVTLTRWWRAGHPDRALGVGVVTLAAGVAVLAGLIPRRRLWWAVGGVSLLTLAVLVADALAGTPLHRGSLLGPSPARGGRYFGFGNDTFCVLAVVALLAAGALAQELLTRDRRRAAVAAVVVVGTVTVLVDVAPTWGADVGGGLALLPGFALLALTVADVEVTVPRLAGAGLGGVGLVAAVALADWLRPASDRSHLGRFVQDLLDGDAGEIVARKAGYARDSLDGSIAGWITLAVLVAATAALLRPERWAPGPLVAAFAGWPTLRASLGAILLTVVAGSLLNDYGLRIATISLTVGMPLVALTCARAAGRSAGGPAGRSAAAAPAGPGHRPAPATSGTGPGTRTPAPTRPRPSR